ncbi:MAG: hypothetical protein ACUZ8O_01425 [Candidatus Anammoxibacter sp.]
MLGIPQECPSCKCTSIKKGDALFTDTLNPIEPFRRLWYTGKGIASIIKKCRRSIKKMEEDISYCSYNVEAWDLPVGTKWLKRTDKLFAKSFGLKNNVD